MATVRTSMTAAGLGAALALAVATAPAHAAVTAYVAVGDSFSSGTGTRSYINDGTACQRSVYAYPSLLAASKKLTLNFRACSGATVANVTNSQLGALSTTTTHVTISVGGNDAGFADVLTECAQAWMSDCNGAIDDAQYIINSVLPSRLSMLYSSIRSKAPNARVTVAGYPRMFNGEDCNAATWFSPEESRLNATADLLNSKTSAQAGAKGFAFANPTSAFVGHAVCDDPEWLNGLSSPITESYHPNRPGHSGYAESSAPSSSARPTRPAPWWRHGRPRVRVPWQRNSAGMPRWTPRSRPRSSWRPTSGRLRPGRPRAAGVDLSSRASIDAADRSYSDRQAAELAARG